MLRELLRSTLYSSRRPFSSSATRDSSFSTLSMSLLPVLCEERPKIFFTLSIIKLKCLCDRSGNPSPHFSLRVCFRFYIRRCVRTCHLRSGILRLVRSFFVLASEIDSRV